MIRGRKSMYFKNESVMHRKVEFIANNEEFIERVEKAGMYVNEKIALAHWPVENLKELK